MRKRILAMVLAFALALAVCPAGAGAYKEMSFSDGFVEYIKRGEGFSGSLYTDGTGSYIGYGCLVNAADYPNGITEPEAEALLRERAQSLAGAINSFLKKYDVSVTQGQFDALCGFAYNFGSSWLSTSNRMPSYIANGLENYTDQEIATSFAAWCHVGGKPVPGLIERRIQEVKMFLYDDYSYTADGWKWIIMDAAGGENEYSDVAVYQSGAAYGRLPVPTRRGYYFAGWQKSGGEMLSASDTVSENLYLTAQWSETPVEADVGEPEPVFDDVAQGEWYYTDVMNLVASGTVQGFGDGTFRPESSVTWGQALRLVTAASGFGEKKSAEGEHWAQGYLDFCQDKGYVEPGAVTDLDRAITRLELADVVAAALELPAAEETPYSDVNTPATGALFAQGLMVGSYDGANRVFKGDKPLRRCEICSMVCRMERYVEENFLFVSGYRVAIDFTRPFNDYDVEAFSTDDRGRVTYSDGSTRTQVGIDVSYYQGEIDWQQVAADGIDFAIVRAGYRTYSSGKLYEDVQFRNNIEGARAAGLKVGVYFFSQATSVAEAEEELEYMLSLLGDFRPDFPVAYDWEPISNSGSRTASYSGATVTACARAFCDGVRAAGMEPMMYFNKTLGLVKFDLKQFDDCVKWLAYYHEKPDYIYEYDIWQYGSSGHVKGIEGNVDMNIMFLK